MVLAALLLSWTASGQSLLQVQGQPYFGGSATLHLSDSSAVGQQALLAFGLDPLSVPLPTGKGPFYIGSLLSVIPLGTIPASGQIDLPFLMPPYDAALEGIPVVLQGYVPGVLSNPATLPLHEPYLQPVDGQIINSPNPSQVANFGYRVALGDLNGDGVLDIAASAAYEDYLGIEKSGRVYVLWGPTFGVSTALASTSPQENGFFGISVTIDHLDGDATADLIVGETAGSPPGPGVTGNLHLYYGAQSFTDLPTLTIPSPGSGTLFTGFGHAVATGDFNNDSFTDIAVSVNKAVVQGMSEAGRIDVYLGPDFGSTVQILNPTPEVGHGFGSAIVTADANGDGIDDIVESSAGDNIAGVLDAGSAHIVLGPAFQLSPTITCPLPMGAVTAFGIYLGAGDLNADGQSEIFITDLKDRVFVMWGPTYATYQVVPKPPSFFQSPFGDSDYGSTLGSADMNGDGLADLLIADGFEGELAGCPIAAEGTLYVVLGPYLGTFHRVSDVAPECGNYFGPNFVTQDIDGNGLTDLVAGVLGADDLGFGNSGHVTVFSN